MTGRVNKALDTDTVIVTRNGKSFTMRLSQLLSSPAAGDAAKIVQSVSTFNSAVDTTGLLIAFDNTIPQVSEGKAAFSSAAFTPIDASNNLLYLEFLLWCSGSVVGSDIIAALFETQFSATNAVIAGAESISNDDSMHQIYATAEIAANFGTPPYTFNLRYGGGGGAFIWSINGDSGGLAKFGGTMRSMIRITELTP